MNNSFRTWFQQLWVPKPFRLPEPEFSQDQIDLLEELVQLIQPTLSMAESASKDDRVQMAQFLVDLGNGIWRIRRKIESLGRMPKEIRDALYSLESTWKSMSEGGVEIVDHIGTVPPPEEARVVEYREIPNIAREQVIEANRPTILLKGAVIQVGEVIMGRPSAHAPILAPEPETPVPSGVYIEVTQPPEPEYEVVSAEIDISAEQAVPIPETQVLEEHVDEVAEVPEIVEAVHTEELTQLEMESVLPGLSLDEDEDAEQTAEELLAAVEEMPNDVPDEPSEDETYMEDDGEYEPPVFDAVEAILGRRVASDVDDEMLEEAEIVSEAEPQLKEADGSILGMLREASVITDPDARRDTKDQDDTTAGGGSR